LHAATAGGHRRLLGLEDYVGPVGFIAPANTPALVLTKLSSAIHTTLAKACDPGESARPGRVGRSIEAQQRPRVAQARPRALDPIDQGRRRQDRMNTE